MATLIRRWAGAVGGLTTDQVGAGPWFLLRVEAAARPDLRLLR
jgi:hypothetical protein